MKRTKAALILTPAILLTSMVFLAPLLLLARYSFNSFRPGEFMIPAFTFENYVNVVLDPYYRSVLITTLLMAAGITILSLALGFPLASYVSKAKRLKKILIICVVLPLFVGNAVRAAGWMLAFGEHGLINSLLLFLGLIDAPLTIMFTPLAVLIGATAVNIPFVALTIQSVLDGLDPAIEEAAASLGATPIETFLKVTLPIAMPGVTAAAVLSFILAMNAYATPVLLGGPSFQMMAPAIADEIISKNNWPVGATLAFVLILTTVVITSIIGRLGAKRETS